jgi:hypothetical protein
MRVELLPLIAGVLVGLFGLALLIDAWTDDGAPGRRNIRRAERVERSRGGEATVGLGALCMAAALMGRDNWSYSVVAVIAGAVLLILGSLANRSYLREAIGNRGASRRRD